MGVDPSGDVPAAGDVDEAGVTHRERVDVVVGHGGVVAAEARHEPEVGAGGQPDHLDAVPFGQQERRGDGRLRRCAGDHRGRGSEQVVVAQEVVDDERRHHQRPQEHLLGFAIGVVDGVALDEGVAAVDGGHGAPGGRQVGEAAVVDPPGLDHHLVGHREVAVDPGRLGHARRRRLDDLAEPPHRDASPAGPLFRCREARPVAHGLAVDGVGDVVRCQAEGVDTQSGLAGLERHRGTLDRPHPVQVRLVDLEVHLLTFRLRIGRRGGTGDRGRWARTIRTIQTILPSADAGGGPSAAPDPAARTVTVDS